MHFYLPELQNPAQGLVRTIVKDSTDLYINETSETWLDSGLPPKLAALQIPCAPHLLQRSICSVPLSDWPFLCGILHPAAGQVVAQPTFQP